jgi:methionine aminotransferase
MSIKLSSKLPGTRTSIFAVISKMSHNHNALNLSQGYPDFPVDPKLIELVDQAMKNGKNQYAPLAGIMSLRETLCEKMNGLYGSDYKPETDITVTAGATQAIFTAISAFVEKDDEVIVFKPAYDCYEPAIKLNGGKPVLLEMKAPEHQIDWEEVRQNVSDKTKMIVINTPHNPSGKMLSKKDMESLQKITEGTDILVLSDEVYEHIVFDGKQHQSVARFPKLRKRSLAVFSFGKTFHATGWKTGYAIGPENLMREFQKVHQYNVFCANHPIQWALNEYLQNPENYLGLSEFYQQKRDLFLKLLQGSRFEFIPSEGTYFQLLKFDNITDEGDFAFAERLIKEYGLASIPVSAFSKNKRDDKMLRFCFAKKDETLEKAGEIISGI